jgi:diguanylate cyclase (GGDEF)-like protein
LINLFDGFKSPVLNRKRSEYIQHTLPFLRMAVASIAFLEYLWLGEFNPQVLIILTIAVVYSALCLLLKWVKVFFGKYQYIMLLIDQLMVFLLCYFHGGMGSYFTYGFILPVLIFAIGPNYRQLITVLALSLAWLLLLQLLTTFELAPLVIIFTAIALIGVVINVTVSNDLSIFTRYAVRDGLTGLFTQRYFYEHLDILINDPTTSKRPFGLIMIDLDDFKQLNDDLGHVEGDRILREIADTLKSTVRDSDVVVRYGGDEFAIILPGVEYQLCQTIVERVRAAIISLEHFNNVSIGSALYPDEADQIDDLVNLADTRMYQQKRQTKLSKPWLNQPL